LYKYGIISKDGFLGCNGFASAQSSIVFGIGKGRAMIGSGEGFGDISTDHPDVVEAAAKARVLRSAQSKSPKERATELKRCIRYWKGPGKKIRDPEVDPAAELARYEEELARLGLPVDEEPAPVRVQVSKPKAKTCAQKPSTRKARG
jgi:hypothetical protein